MDEYSFTLFSIIAAIIIICLSVYNKTKKSCSKLSEKSNIKHNITSSMTIEDSILNKYITNFNKSKSHISTNTKDQLSILSYNILSQQIVNISKMRKNKHIYLSFEYRIKGIISHIKCLNCDIINLQEVTSNALKEINKELHNDYVFTEGENINATFFNIIGIRRKHYELKNYKIFKMSELLNTFEIQGNKGVLKSIFNSRSINSNLVICYNIHMPWRKEHDLFKLFILNEIYIDLKSTIEQNKNDNLIILLSGDFNSTPSCLLHNFINFDYKKVIKCENFNCLKEKIEIIENYLTGKASEKQKVLSILQFDDKNIRAFKQSIVENNKYLYFYLNTILNSYYMSKVIKFKSAYENYKILFKDLTTTINNKNINDGYPEYTNYTTKFRNTIDYIFYSVYSPLSVNNKIKIGMNTIMQLPNIIDLENKNIQSLPNYEFFSDHLPISCQLNIKY